MGWLPILPFHKCKIAPPGCVSLSVTIIGLVFFPLLVLPLFYALAPQQYPIDLGDLLQVIFTLLIILHPPANLLHLIGRNDPSGGLSGSKGDG